MGLSQVREPVRAGQALSDMSSDTLDKATALWLVMSPTARELISLTGDSARLEKRGLELMSRLSAVDKCFILPYLRLAAAKRFMSTLGEERRARLEEFKERRLPRPVPETYPNDPYQDKTREELLDAIVNILENRPSFESNKPLGTRLGVWLKSLEDQVARESLELTDYK